MKKILIILLALTAVLTSCDELLEMEFIKEIQTVKLSRKNVVIMQGDSCRIDLIFDREASVESAFWNSRHPSIASVKNNGLLMAKQVGETDIQVVTVQNRLSDSCHVQVIQKWEDIPCTKYPYDMVVYADVRIDGKLPNDDLVLVAMCGNDLRGYGQVKQSNGITYTLIRIWSPREYGDQITFYCYDHSTVHLQQLPYQVTFDGEAHGTLSSLVLIHN